MKNFHLSACVLGLSFSAVSLMSGSLLAQESATPTAAAPETTPPQEQPAAPLDKNSREYLVALVSAGAEFYDQGKYDEAIVKLKEAYSLKPSATIGIALARAYRDNRRIGEAIDLYSVVAETEVNEESHPKLIEAVESAKKEETELKEKANWLSLAVSGPDTFQVDINGEPGVPYRTGAYVLMPGAYTIKVSADGYVSRTIEYIAQAGRKPLQVVELSPVPVALPVAVAPKQKAQAKKPPPPERTAAFKALGWTSTSLGIVGVMGGAALVVYVSTEETRSDDFCTDDVCSPGAQVHLDNARQAANAATAAFAVGGALFGGGVALLIYDGVHQRKYEEKYAYITDLQVAVRPQGFALKGSF